MRRNGARAAEGKRETGRNKEISRLGLEREGKR